MERSISLKQVAIMNEEFSVTQSFFIINGMKVTAESKMIDGSVADSDRFTAFS